MEKEFIENLIKNRKNNWKTFKPLWVEGYRREGIENIYEPVFIDDIEQALRILNIIFKDNFCYGADLKNGYKFDNIVKISNDENVLTFSEDRSLDRTYSFIFKSLIIIPPLKSEENIESPIIFIESEDWDIDKEYEEFVEKEGNFMETMDLIYNNDLLIRKDQLTEFFYKRDEGEIPVGDVKERFRILNAGIVGFFNVQGLEFSAGRSMLSKIPEKLTGVELYKVLKK